MRHDPLAMRLPMFMLRWLHRGRLLRGRLRGGWLHGRLGDRVLDKSLWRPTPESVARAWLVGFPITMTPFLPFQSVLACVAAVAVRGNLLLCVLLQFLSSPLTAPLHLPLCYFAGEFLRGRRPAFVWSAFREAPESVFTGDKLFSLYLGATVLGAVIGVVGYLGLRRWWRLPRVVEKRGGA